MHMQKWNPFRDWLFSVVGIAERLLVTLVQILSWCKLLNVSKDLPPLVIIHHLFRNLQFYNIYFLLPLYF